MKKRISIIVMLFIAASSIFISCDKVDDIFDTPPQAFDPRKKVLVEDFTGHRCSNCPFAARLLYDSIQKTYPGQVIGIGVHAGFFANPVAPGTGCLAVDYRSDAGNQLNTLFGVTALGNPTGLVNRIDFKDNNIVKYGSEWPTAVASVLQKPLVALIEIESDYDSSSRVVEMTIKTRFESLVEGNYKLAVIITEDNLYSCQLDIQATPNLVANYRHRHVLRSDVNGYLGEALITNPFPSEIYSRSYTFYLSDNWVDNNCSIVAYVYDAETYEIVQAEELKIIE